MNTILMTQIDNSFQFIYTNKTFVASLLVLELRQSAQVLATDFFHPEILIAFVMYSSDAFPLIFCFRQNVIV